MNAALTVQDLFRLILYLLGICSLMYLIIALKNISKLISKVNTIIELNEKSIDQTLKQLPLISENINSITEDTDIAIKSLTPEINNLVHNINNISGKVDSITDSIDSTTHKVSETFDIVTEGISDTAFVFQNNIKNIDNYIRLIIEIIEGVKNALRKR